MPHASATRRKSGFVTTDGDLVKLKLAIDLVPKPCWYLSVRRYFPRSIWNRLRLKVIADQGSKCGFCKSRKDLHCHEIWEYDDKKRTQTFVRFHLSCRMCHFVNHFGLSAILASERRLDLEAVIRHFMKVNKVKRAVFEAHKTEAFDLWKKRSKRKWKTVFGDLDGYGILNDKGKVIGVNLGYLE